MPRRIQEYTAVSRWAINAEIVVTHRVSYTVLDDEFDLVSDNMLLWSSQPQRHGGWKENNTLYIAADHLMLDGRIAPRPGFGLFKTGFRLTESHAPRPSIWSVPDWLNPTRGGVGLTYHPSQRWSSSRTLEAAARGQEFVADITNRADALAWLDQLFAQEA
ncbi:MULTISPECIES: DUF6012 family protein [Pseudomonas aeruginosa group]|uniref:DUF6012 family protein n=1 Tax=Pseudomonas aeruginosa group TaxID=136841 RepID=UPI00214F6762|nr:MULTISPECIES: DUF6012 family protein [Pseudomonas aeruginosa group]MCS9398847.1 DUF6012 family protein [Pseudomonas aeruginosa]MCT0411025.1 DUF6012 family protein [Pseudomonas aeruginosa]